LARLLWPPSKEMLDNNLKIYNKKPAYILKFHRYSKSFENPDGEP